MARSRKIAIKNNFVFVNFKFNIDEEENVKTIFETHGEGLYETFVVDHVSNRSLFVKKLVEKFPSGKIRSYESFPIEKSDLFRIGSAEITIEIKEFET